MSRCTTTLTLSSTRPLADSAAAGCAPLHCVIAPRPELEKALSSGKLGINHVIVEYLSRRAAYMRSAGCGANRMKQRRNSLSVVLFGYGSLHEACRLRAHRCNVGANSNLLGYGSLHGACRLRADGCNKDGMRTMGQAAISCTDRKPPGSCRGAPSDKPSCSGDAVSRLLLRFALGLYRALFYGCCFVAAALAAFTALDILAALTLPFTPTNLARSCGGLTSMCQVSLSPPDTP
jgi:hypothetical protein